MSFAPPGEPRPRLQRHRRNADLESVLDRLNQALAEGGDQLAAEHVAPRHPIVLIVGCPRSGTTLFLQWLAAAGVFTVPSNLVSRFYRAPAIGAMVERMLFDPALDFRSELQLPGGDESTFESALGKTSGPTQPNEFWYFWRRFFPFDRTTQLERESAVDRARLRRELAAWEAVGDRPLAMKALLLNWHLPLLAQILDRAVFVDIVRDPVFNMKSLLKARREFFGDESAWYSLRPPEYDRLRALDPIQQVAGQVRATRRAIDAGLARIPARRRIRVDYEQFCAAPEQVWRELVEVLENQGYTLPEEPPGVSRFEVRNRFETDERRADAIRRAWIDSAGP